MNKLKEAQSKAQNYDKKGLQKAIVQYQFELNDKEEENCFNDLYEQLNELF